jgi:hypothetical protein
MNWPTWTSIGQAAASTPTWGDIADNASFQIEVSIEIASVKASWWAVGKSEQEIMAKVKENFQKGK